MAAQKIIGIFLGGRSSQEATSACIIYNGIAGACVGFLGTYPFTTPYKGWNVFVECFLVIALICVAASLRNVVVKKSAATDDH